jgi:hypothetical protein
MLCAFAGPPRILRLHGRGRHVVPGDAEFDELSEAFEIRETFRTGPAQRSVVVVDVERIADSCGYGVPLMEPAGDRPQQALWVDRKLAKGGEAALDAYRAEHNVRSIDGLPALDV